MWKEKKSVQKQKIGYNISYQKCRNLFDKMGLRALWGSIFCQSGCTDLTQKDCPDHRKGLSFLPPVPMAIGVGSGNFYGMGSEGLQIMEKSPVRCQAVTKQAP